MKNKHFYLFFCLLLTLINLQTGKVYVTQPPTWLTSSYCRAGNQKVINVTTGNSSTPIYTFIFSSPLSGIPSLAYGIKGYYPSDYLLQQILEIKRVNLTASSFTVSLQIYGITNIQILNVAYITIDPLFPHHLNSFENVPINYSSVLTNITVSSTAPTYFTQIVNYTSQAATKTIKTFALPLSSNKIVLMLTNFNIWTTNANGTTLYPASIEITTSVQNTTHYSIAAKVSTKVKILALGFSEIIFNEDDIIASNRYAIIFQVWETPQSGGFKHIPIEFVDNFIMAIMEFKTTEGKCGFEYIWDFGTVNSTYGVILQPSITNLSSSCAFSSMKSSIFYLKTWQCNSPYDYFNLTTNLCQDLCAQGYYEIVASQSCLPCLASCLNCQSSSPLNCTQCDLANDHRILNNVTNQCDCISGYFDQANSSVCVTSSCVPITGCSICINNTHCSVCLPGYINVASICIACVPTYGCSVCKNNTHCLVCDSALNYKIDPLLEICICNDGYIPNPLNSSLCIACSPINGCLVCKSNTLCITCDLSQGFQLNALQVCVCASGYVTDPLNSSACVPCVPINGCSICLNDTHCSVCDGTAGYILDTSLQCVCDVGYSIDPLNSSLCVSCTPTTGCLVCKNDTHCLVCDISQGYQINDTLSLCFCTSGYYRSPNSTACIKCGSLEGCDICKDATHCQKCLEDQVYVLDANTEVCVQVSQSITAIKCSLIIGLVSVFLLLFIKSSLPTAQLISGLQLCYLSLGTVTNLPPIISSIRWIMKPILGYNPNFLPKPLNQIFQKPIKQLSFESSFFYNINAMILIEFIALILLIVLYFAVKRWQKIRIIYQVMQKQLLIIIIFNAPNIFFSVPLMSESSTIEIIVAGIAILLVIMQFADVFSSNNKYLGFEETFKVNSRYKTYIFFWIVGRLVCSAIITFLRDSPKSAILVVWIIQCLDFIPLIILQSYRKTISKVCVLGGEICLMLFISFNLVYSYAKLSDDQEHLKTIFSILQILLLLFLSIFTLFSAVVALIYDWFLKKNKKVLSEKNSQSKLFNENIKQNPSLGAILSPKMNIIINDDQIILQKNSAILNDFTISPDKTARVNQVVTNNYVSDNLNQEINSHTNISHQTIRKKKPSRKMKQRELRYLEKKNKQKQDQQKGESNLNIVEQNKSEFIIEQL